MMRGMDPIELDTYSTDAFGREAIDFIERHVVEPSFLALQSVVRKAGGGRLGDSGGGVDAGAQRLGEEAARALQPGQRSGAEKQPLQNTAGALFSIRFLH